MGVRSNGFKRKNHNIPVPSGGFLGNESLMPETVLPAQFYVSSAKESGEKRLLLAVLEDAIHCLQRYCRSESISQRRLYREAKEWIESGEEKPYTFHFVCTVLNLDPDKLRAGLKKWLYPQLPESGESLPLFKRLPLKAVRRHLYQENHRQTLALEKSYR